MASRSNLLYRLAFVGVPEHKRPSKVFSCQLLKLAAWGLAKESLKFLWRSIISAFRAIGTAVVLLLKYAFAIEWSEEEDDPITIRGWPKLFGVVVRPLYVIALAFVWSKALNLGFWAWEHPKESLAFALVTGLMAAVVVMMVAFIHLAIFLSKALHTDTYKILKGAIRSKICFEVEFN